MLNRFATGGSGKYFYLLLICILIIPFRGISQNAISSPYSRFGIGDLSWKGFGQSSAMGGTAIGIQNKHHLNMINPASYSGLESGADSMSFTFEFALNNRITWLKTNNLSQSNNDISFAYMAMGFPITKKIYASTGIIPFSNVGYILNDNQFYTGIGDVNFEYVGSGGINQYYIGASGIPIENLSVGFNFSYLFGSLDQRNSVSFPSGQNYLNSTKSDKIIISDIQLNFGAQYSVPIKDDYKLIIGGVYTGKTNLNVRHDLLQTNTSTQISDTVLFINDEKNTIVLPQSYGIGFSFSKNNKFTIGADYYQQNWKEASFLGVKDSLANSNRISAGIEYIPNYRAQNNYFQRVKYRAGFHFGNTYLQLRGIQLNEAGISFGLSLPIPKPANNQLSESLININFEIGKRGTLDNNLIKENYALISINLTLQDVWFKKHKWQ